MNPGRSQVLHDALHAWVESAQIDMMIEEMSELTKALLKARRLTVDQLGTPEHTRRIDDIREEMADVQIMLDQMRIIFGGTEDHEQAKIARLSMLIQDCRQNAKEVAHESIGSQG